MEAFGWRCACGVRHMRTSSRPCARSSWPSCLDELESKTRIDGPLHIFSDFLTLRHLTHGLCEAPRRICKSRGGVHSASRFSRMYRSSPCVICLCPIKRVSDIPPQVSAVVGHALEHSLVVTQLFLGARQLSATVSERF